MICVNESPTYGNPLKPLKKLVKRAPAGIPVVALFARQSWGDRKFDPVA
jgi:hypothetical protein